MLAAGKLHVKNAGHGPACRDGNGPGYAFLVSTVSTLLGCLTWALTLMTFTYRINNLDYHTVL